MSALDPSMENTVPEEEPRILLAWLCAPWGRKGAVALEVHTDWPEQRFVVGHSLHLSWEDGREREVVVRAFRRQGKKFVIEFEGVDDIAGAKRLRGASISAKAGELERESDDVLLHCDLLNLGVFTRQGDHVGRVLRIEEGVAADLLVVGAEDRREILIPLAEEICTVDLEARRVVIDPPDGLLDLDASSGEAP